MAKNSGFANRMNLPRVLETLHRFNAFKVLRFLDIQIAGDASWDDIVATTERTNDTHVLTWTVYAGQVRVDGLFGLNGWVLIESRPTEQVIELADTYPGSNDDLFRHLVILLRRRRETIHVMLIPDTPPIALYERDIDYAKNLYTGGRPGQLDNDAEIIRIVQQAFGEDAVYFLDEVAAGNLINALQQDQSSCALSPD